MKKGIKNVQNIILSSQEKEDMFTRIDSHMKENPMKIESHKVFMLYDIFVSFRNSTFIYKPCKVLATWLQARWLNEKSRP